MADSNLLYVHVVVDWPNFDSLLALVEPLPVVRDTCTTSEHQGMHCLEYVYSTLSFCDHDGKLQLFSIYLADTGSDVSTKILAKNTYSFLRV